MIVQSVKKINLKVEIIFLCADPMEGEDIDKKLQKYLKGLRKRQPEMRIEKLKSEIRAFDWQHRAKKPKVRDSFIFRVKDISRLET